MYIRCDDKKLKIIKKNKINVLFYSIINHKLQQYEKNNILHTIIIFDDKNLQSK